VLNVNRKFKNVRQRFEQKMIDFIIYISDLKSQLSMKFIDHTLYNYMINTLRLSLKDEVIRKINTIKIRAELKKNRSFRRKSRSRWRFEESSNQIRIEIISFQFLR
jgi:hypothetical protein